MLCIYPGGANVGLVLPNVIAMQTLQGVFPGCNPAKAYPSHILRGTCQSIFYYNRLNS